MYADYAGEGAVQREAPSGPGLSEAKTHPADGFRHARENAFRGPSPFFEQLRSRRWRKRAFELDGRAVAQRRVQPLFVVDLFEEPLESKPDPRTGRAMRKVLFDGMRRAAVPLDLRGHETPEWPLAEYAPRAPAAGRTSGISGTPGGGTGCEVPPSAGASVGPLSPEGSPFVPGTGSGEPPSPNSGAPDTSLGP